MKKNLLHLLTLFLLISVNITPAFGDTDDPSPNDSMSTINNKISWYHHNITWKNMVI